MDFYFNDSVVGGIAIFLTGYISSRYRRNYPYMYNIKRIPAHNSTALLFGIASPVFIYTLIYNNILGFRRIIMVISPPNIIELKNALITPVAKYKERISRLDLKTGLPNNNKSLLVLLETGLLYDLFNYIILFGRSAAEILRNPNILYR